MKKIFFGALLIMCACATPNNTDDTVNDKDDRTDYGGNNQNDYSRSTDTIHNPGNHKSWGSDTLRTDQRYNNNEQRYDNNDDNGYNKNRDTAGTNRRPVR